MFFLLNCKLYLKWSKFLWNFTAWVIIETTGFECNYSLSICAIFSKNGRPWTQVLVSSGIWLVIREIMSLTSLLLIRELRPRATRTASPYINKNGKVTKKSLKQVVWVNWLQKLNYRLWSLVLSHCKLGKEHEKNRARAPQKAKTKATLGFPIFRTDKPSFFFRNIGKP